MKVKALRLLALFLLAALLAGITGACGVPRVPVAGETVTVWRTESYTFTDAEAQREQAAAAAILADPETYLAGNAARWDGYLAQVPQGESIAEPYQRAAVKSIETMMTNYRSAAGDLLHGGVVPSMSYKWFIGLWAWDSWKQAVGLAAYAPEVAMENGKRFFGIA